MRTTNQLLVEHVVEVVNLFGGMIERAVTCLTMQEAREVEQIYLLVDALGNLWVECVLTFCRHYLLVALANDELGMTDDVIQ